MSNERPPSAEREGRESGLPDAAFANLHRIYRDDLGTLQVAIANATGDQRRRLESVLANLRAEKR